MGFPSRKGAPANTGLREEEPREAGSNIRGFTCWAGHMFHMLL